jgi:hypothetical protein
MLRCAITTGGRVERVRAAGWRQRAGAVALLWGGAGYLITKPAVPGHVDDGGKLVDAGLAQARAAVGGRAVHVVVLVSIAVAVAALLTTIDPIQLTEYALIFSASLLPPTYLPILVVANDRGLPGRQGQRPVRPTRSASATW